MTSVLPIFVINLDRSPERLARFSLQCADAGISFERFRGVDGTALPDRLKPYFCDTSGLSAGEIGCYASHLSVWGMICDRNIPAALVCEDDAKLSPDLASIIAETLSVLPDRWDLVRLCRAPKRAIRPVAPLSAGRQIVQYTKIPLGSAGYLISLAGAGKLLRPRKAWASVDVEIAHAWDFDLDVYGVFPPPIAQDRTASFIGVRGETNRWRRAMPTPSRVAFNPRKMGVTGWLRCLALNLTRKLRPRRPATF